MAAIDNLTSAISGLTVAVNTLIAGQPAPGGATEAQVQTAADEVNAQTARITALIPAAGTSTAPAS